MKMLLTPAGSPS